MRRSSTKGVARDDAAKFRRDGPGWSTRELIDELAAGIALDGSSVIDIGAGVGAVHLGLLTRGAARAVDLDGSSAYLAAAAGEAKRLGFEDRVQHVLGDAIVLGPTLEPADLVALDRVICCSGDVAGLLGTRGPARPATHRARLSARQLVDPGGDDGRQPGVLRPFGRLPLPGPPPATVAALLGAAGFAPLTARNGRLWRVETWERTAAGVSPRPSPAAAAPYPSG